MRLKLANMRNGLAYEHDDICYFQSCFGHRAKLGYFRQDSMPLQAVVTLLLGGTIEIIDASRHKELSDALKYGVPTWCIVFNRALDFKSSRHVKVCSWQTIDMKRVALSHLHKGTVQTIRKLISIFGYVKPAVVEENVILTCYRGINFDDNPRRIREQINCLNYQEKNWKTLSDENFSTKELPSVSMLQQEQDGAKLKSKEKYFPLIMDSSICQ